MNATYALFTFQLIAFIILVLLMHDLYRKLRKETAARPDTRPGPESAQLRAGVDDMVSELRRAADRINADIQARASTLQKLIDEADQRMRALDAAVARHEAGRAAPRRPEPARQTAPDPAPGRAATRASAPPAPPPPRRPIEAPRPDPVAAADPWPGAPASETTRTLPQVAPASGSAGNAYRQAARAAGTPAPPPPREPAPRPVANNPQDDGFIAVGPDDAGKFQTVRRMATEGMSAVEIARATRMGREEVELIMQLSGEARP